MPVALQFVLIVPSFTFRSIPVWMINYMVMLPICQTKPGFLKLGTVDIWSWKILSWGLGLILCEMFSSILASTH